MAVDGTSRARHDIAMPIPHSYRIASALLLALTTISATPPPEPDEIVVTAVPTNPAERRKAVSSFVGKVSQSAVQNQLSRRMSAYCPKVLGLEDKYVPLVEAKLEEAEEAARLKRLPAGCTTDMLVIFTQNGDALMEALQKKKPVFFLYLEPWKSRELFKSGRAVRWWYENQGKSQNGATVGNDPRAAQAGASVAELTTNQIYSASLITTPIKVNLSGNVVVIDVSKAEGYPLNAIASYAAMVSFAQVSARDNVLGDVPSVLGMFNRPGPRGEALKDLTVWDRAYLSALYKIPMNRNFDRQRNALRGAMLEAIEGY